MTSSWSDSPLRTFSPIFLHIIIFISLEATVSTILSILWIWNWTSKLLPITLTVVAPATSLSIYQVLLVLAPLQIWANLQIRAPPLHRRQLTQSRNSKRWFIHYLSLQSWILTVILNTLLLQLATWTLLPKPHYLTFEKP